MACAAVAGAAEEDMSGKYHAVKVTEDGYVFDSKSENRRYRELLLLQSAGQISDLRVHHRLRLVVNAIDCGYYEADFDYVVGLGLAHIFEDVKGIRTAVYRLKKKLVFAIHDISIEEVTA